jgi:rhodanese-related sulfurtransferase
MRLVILFFMALILLLNCKNETPNMTNNIILSNAETHSKMALPTKVDTNLVYLDAVGFENILQKKPNTAIIDLRSVEDFSKIHIYKAINRPYSESDEFFSYFTGLEVSQPIALYDTDGSISIKVGQTLAAKHNFVYVLRGGIYSWYKARKPAVAF